MRYDGDLYSERAKWHKDIIFLKINNDSIAIVFIDALTSGLHNMRFVNFRGIDYLEVSEMSIESHVSIDEYKIEKRDLIWL
jgi:hypothetical protein